MQRRLINFRNTQDFAYVKSKQKSMQTSKGIIWSSCNAGGGEGGGSLGIKKKIQTGFGRTKAAQENIELGTNLLVGGFALIGTLAGAPVGASLAVAGTIFAVVGNMTQKVTFSKPCPISDPLSFDEPTFEEFHQNILIRERIENREERINRGEIQ
jgi:hypothetical protein